MLNISIREMQIKNTNNTTQKIEWSMLKRLIKQNVGMEQLKLLARSITTLENCLAHFP